MRLALETEGSGYDVVIVANADTCMSTPSMDLVAQVFPGVKVRRHVDGTGTLRSIDKARRVLGFEPEHSWRDDFSP